MIAPRYFLLYVSGPMTPTPAFPNMEENVARLEAKARALFTMGYAVICPVFSWFDKHPPYLQALKADKYGKTYQDIIALDLELVGRCDGIYMLSGWETSRGAAFEHDHALRCLVVPYYEDCAEPTQFFEPKEGDSP